MTAQSADRKSIEIASALGEDHTEQAAPAQTFYHGSAVMKDLNSGLLFVGTATTASCVVGVARESKTTVSGSTLNYRNGIHMFENSTSSDLITTKEVGKLCYLQDDATVAKTSNSTARSIAGRVHSVNTDGKVFVTIRADLIPSGTTV